MTITAEVITDSFSEHSGKRLTTFVLSYPRFIHAEVMTHRVFSRNASSSRAIPITKMIQALKDDPAMPERWGRNGKGMQDHGELSDDQQSEAMRLWLLARDNAISVAGKMLAMKEPPHKQIVNRILEPFQHIHVVMTSVDYANFYGLRYHKDADPTIEVLARRMFKAQESSEPKGLRHGEWHLPFVRLEDHEHVREYLSQRGLGLEDLLPQEVQKILIKLSVARCARVSHLNHQGRVPVVHEDLELHDRLVGADPKHASPAEHQATPDTGKMVAHSGPTRDLRWQWSNPKFHGNLEGWCQYRKTISGECITSFAPPEAA